MCECWTKCYTKCVRVWLNCDSQHAQTPCTSHTKCLTQKPLEGHSGTQFHHNAVPVPQQAWLLCTAAHGAAEHAYTLTWADAIDTAARASAASRMMDVVLMLLVVGLPAGGSNSSSSSRRGKQQQIHKHR